MKRLKHIWKYLTSPSYRYLVDFCSQQEFLNRNMKMIEDNLRLQSYPMFRVENGKIQKLNPPQKRG